jgi:hypothetical protein
MKYACIKCKKLHCETEWNEMTTATYPKYAVVIGDIGWKNSTYVCPDKNCLEDNAGYELKTEDQVKREEYEKILEEEVKRIDFPEYS